MDTSDLSQYLTQNIDMALGLQGESSYTNSFQIKVQNNGFYFIPRMPAGYLIDDILYQKIYAIANIALYPEYTLLKQNSLYIVPLNTGDIHVQRALFFPWVRGISKRLVIPNLEEFVAQKVTPTVIPIMQNLVLNYNKVVGIAIAGNSGGGKSYFLTYLLQSLKQIMPSNNLVIIDPKMDTPTRWALANNIKAIYPTKNRSKSDFLSQVNGALSNCLSIIYQRQQILLKNPKTSFHHVTLAIDEVMALTEGVNKNIKDAFFALLSQIALLGRATKVHLLLVSQRFDYNTIPVSVREQLNCLIQLGNINKSTTKFLFDVDPEGIVIPIGKGTGIIQVIDGEHPHQILPLLTPTYYMRKEGIL